MNWKWNTIELKHFNSISCYGKIENQKKSHDPVTYVSNAKNYQFLWMKWFQWNGTKSNQIMHFELNGYLNAESN